MHGIGSLNTSMLLAPHCGAKTQRWMHHGALSGSDLMGGSLGLVLVVMAGTQRETEYLYWPQDWHRFLPCLQTQDNVQDFKKSILPEKSRFTVLAKTSKLFGNINNRGGCWLHYCLLKRVFFQSSPLLAGKIGHNL